VSHRHAAAEGHGEIVLVGGEAGIGKSRLLREFESMTSSSRAISASARCVEFAQTPLSPLRDLLGQLERRSIAPRDAATDSLVKRLAFEGNLFDSIDDAFARYALHGTVVCTIEDLHWADRSTLAFLTYFADRIEKRRILIVATYRTDEVGSQYPHLSEFSALLSKRLVSTISLSPLSESAIRALIEDSVPAPHGISPMIAAEITRRSQGNPFFAEELIKSALDAERGNAVAELPLSVRAAVLARASRLSEEERGVISLAAVLGERFAVAQLIALFKDEREVVLRALEHARALRLIYDNPAAPSEVAFRHALTQEVLYGELLAERVRPLHEAIAIELSRRADENVVQLAHHWRRAGDLQKAAQYDEVAGDGAFAIGAFADAILYFERALASRPGNALLEHKLGVALGSMNELDAAIERLRHAGDLYWRGADFEGFTENASALIAQLYNRGDVAAATAACHTAIETLGEKVESEKLDLFRTRLAFQCIAALDYDSASAFLNQIREPITDPKVAMHASWNRFRVAAMRGEIDEWSAFATRALDAARRLDDGGSWTRHLHIQIGIDAVGLGDGKAAREHFRAAILPKRERQSLQGTMLSAASAFEHTLRGDFPGAAEILHGAERLAFQSYPILVHVKSANFALGICSGDEARLHRDDTETFLRYGIEHGMQVAIGILGGPYAWALGIRGERDAAASWIAKIASILPGPHRFLFAYLAAAQFGDAKDVIAMRKQLAGAAGRPQDRVNKAALGLFDAFASARGLVEIDVRVAALDAAARFDAIGWPWLAARASELGGDSKRSSETYRALGALRDLQRVETARSSDSVSALSSRELEVAELVAAGHSNDDVARLLHISSRTAEKHVSSALRKLNVRSRVQLGRLLARSLGDAR
jgi:DNA-binding CsgD family transcriptional regulator